MGQYSNAVYLRISYVIILVLVGGIVAVAHLGKLITPLAIFILPTESAQARVTTSGIMVKTEMRSGEQSYEYPIAYAGNTDTITTTKALLPFISEQDLLRRHQDRTRQILMGRAPSPEPPTPEPTFTVRFVRAFPSMVVHEIPNGSLRDYYRETWNGGEVVPFLFASIILCGVSCLLWRNVAQSRRRQRS